MPPTAPCSHEITLPSITTPFPSMKATRERPSQFLNVSATSGCWGWKEHSAISFDFSECGSSIFFPPVSLPIFHESLEMRQAVLVQSFDVQPDVVPWVGKVNATVMHLHCE